jgi:uncharacterized protein (DUF1499 family)
MKILGYLVLLVVVLAVLALIAGQLGLLKGKAPSNLGVRDGKLKPPAKTPNSVTSQASLHAGHPQLAYASIEPIKFTGDADSAMKKLADLLQKQERTVVISRDSNYIYAQCSTALMKYTDDVEFMMDKAAGVIHVRSSSRVGRKDFGVNRARIEAIRAQFNAAG